MQQMMGMPQAHMQMPQMSTSQWASAMAGGGGGGGPPPQHQQQHQYAQPSFQGDPRMGLPHIPGWDSGAAAPTAHYAGLDGSGVTNEGVANGSPISPAILGAATPTVSVLSFSGLFLVFFWSFSGIVLVLFVCSFVLCFSPACACVRACVTCHRSRETHGSPLFAHCRRARFARISHLTVLLTSLVRK
jgi:hypothetical protein